MENLHFKGFHPDQALEKKAERAIESILEHAPFELCASVTLEKTGDVYRCEIEVKSEQCPMKVEGSHRLAAIALDKAELGVLRKVAHWRNERYRRLEDLPAHGPSRAASQAP